MRAGSDAPVGRQRLAFPFHRSAEERRFAARLLRVREFLTHHREQFREIVSFGGLGAQILNRAAALGDGLFGPGDGAITGPG